MTVGLISGGILMGRRSSGGGEHESDNEGAERTAQPAGVPIEVAGGRVYQGVGPALRERRERLGYTQPTVAAMLGVHKSEVSRWEKAVGPPNRAYVEKLAEIYLGTVEELLAGYIPAYFPAHRIVDSRTRYEQGQGTQGETPSKEEIVREALRNINVNLSTLKELAPGELLAVGMQVLRMREEVDKRERAQGQGTSEE